MQKALYGLIALLALIVLISWFSGDAPPETPGPSELTPAWSPTTEAFSLDCGNDCQTVRAEQQGRHGVQIPLVYNPAVDDPVAQWGDCVASVIQCVETDQAPASCIRNSACPANCLAALEQQVPDDANEQAALDAFEALFIRPGASCRPEPRS